MALVPGLFAQPEVLRVGWDDFEPYQYDVNGQPGGLDIAMVQAVGQKMGWILEFHKMPWVRQLASLREGSLDLVFDATPTAERETFGSFSVPYREERAALMALVIPHPRPTTLQEFLDRGHVVGIERGSDYGDDWARLMQVPRYRSAVDEGTDLILNLKKLVGRRIDALIDDPLVAQTVARNQGLPRPIPLLTVSVNRVSLFLSQAWLASHPDQLARLNGTIDELVRSGSFRALGERWGVEEN
jgi:ABC-type amino acid transport substrate-binding protein